MVVASSRNPGGLLAHESHGFVQFTGQRAMPPCMHRTTNTCIIRHAQAVGKTKSALLDSADAGVADFGCWLAGLQRLPVSARLAASG